MSKYIILTDSSCDLTQKLVEEMELAVVPLSVTLPDGQYANYIDEREITMKDFYGRLRAGQSCSSSAVNTGIFLEEMEKWLEQDYDILYLGFSSGLSGTFSAGVKAAEEMRVKFPERTIVTVDTLCASLGQGLIVYYAAEKKKEGLSLAEVAEYVEKIKLSVCHWFTVEDLQFLRRGGRISGASAVLGSILQIKPVLRVDDEGKLMMVTKVRGRKASLQTMADRMLEQAKDSEENVAFISHSDCLEDAEALAAAIRQRMKVKDIIISYIGPVIGTHTGPGGLALFFIGEKRA